VRHTQRIQKTLEDANIKLDGVLTDILGGSGRAMLRAIIAGETDPHKLVVLAHPLVKASRDALAEARGVTSPRTTGSCSSCTSIRSSISKRPSTRSTRRSRQPSNPFEPRSGC